MKTRLLVILWLLATELVSAQQTSHQLTTFSIPFGTDTTQFVLVGDRHQLNSKKPILVFRQGSLPIPLLTRNPKNQQISLTELPAPIYNYRHKYHILMIAKPGIPLQVEDTYLDTLFSGKPALAMYPRAYHARNYLEYYVDQTNAVLAYVLKQPWADARRVVIVGGSEGYQVSLKTAYTNKQITHLIAFSGNVEGRQQAQIREARASGIGSPLQQAQAQQMVERLQKDWLAVCRDSLNTTNATVGDSNRSIYSFSHTNNLHYLTSLPIPVCIVSGTADVRSHSNDVLPLEFARRGKTNLTLKTYVDLDHSLRRISYDSSGQVVGKVYDGNRVHRDYLEWLDTH